MTYPVIVVTKAVEFDVTASIVLLTEQAKKGSRKAESLLVNVVCSLKKSATVIPPYLTKVVVDALTFLAKVGRKINFHAPEERKWISARGGAPRW